MAEPTRGARHAATASYTEHLPDPAERLAGGELLEGPSTLVLVDLQRLDADPLAGVGPQLLAADARGLVRDYFTRVADIVVPTAAALLERYRSVGAQVVHVRVASPARNGGDLSLRYRQLGFTCAASSAEARFMPGLEPADGEAVIDKITSSAFVGTVLGTWLRSLRVQTIVVGGVVTNGCVESTVRNGADLGYRVVLVADACAALSPAEQDGSLAQLHGNFATVTTGAEVGVALR